MTRCIKLVCKSAVRPPAVVCVMPSDCYTRDVRQSGQDPNLRSSLKPVRTRRAFEDIVLQIEQALMEGRIAVGDRLPSERELAEIFEVSRQSVREGLRILEAFGVLSARRGIGPESGSIVSAADGTNGLGGLLRLYASLQHIPVWDLIEIREALELLSTRSAATKASVENARQILVAAERMAEVTKVEEFLQFDTEFHVLIARMSGNTIAPLFMEAIREAMAREMLRAFQRLKDWPSERKVLVYEHIDVAKKIVAHDAEAAARSMSKHIRGFYGRVLQDTKQPRLRRSINANRSVAVSNTAR